MKKRILSLILAVVLLLGCASIGTVIEAKAAGYNATAAVNYAKTHWDDGVGLCDQFVKACLKAGGVNISAGGCGAVYNALKSYGTAYKLIEKQNMYLMKSDNSSMLSAGDPVFYYCSKCGRMVHTVICTGYNKDGQALVSGHNSAWNEYNAAANYVHANKTHRDDDITVYGIHMNGTTTSPSPTPTPVPAVTVATGGAEEITTNSALLRGTVTGDTKPSEVGMYLGASESNMTFLGSDSTSGGSPWKFYYRTAGKRSLTPNTTYYYRAYAKLSSGTVWGDTKSFKTRPSSTVVTTGAAEEITETSALVRATVTGNTKPSKVGMYFGTSSNNMTELGSEGTSGGSPWKYYYRTAKQNRTLNPGTYYYYQAYAVVSGQTIWGEIKSFKTKGTTPTCTQHQKGTFLFYEAAHPHKNYYTCAICGAKFTDNSTVVVTSCSQCVNIKLSKTSLSMKAGGIEKLTAVTTPAAQGVTWVSSDTSVAAVVDGEIVALRAGTVTVTAKMTYQSKEVTASCTVTITADETPEVYTQNVADITKTSATLHGMAYSEYGTIDEAGMYFGTSRDNLSLLGSNRTTGENAVTLEYTVGKNGQPLTEGTTYYFQVYAKVGGKEYRGEVVPFTTSFGDSKFADVKVGQYYYDAVAWAVDNGITSGTSATAFSPEQSCTRAQAVTFLWRAAGEPEPAGGNTGFTDVKAGAYYEKAVRWAVENGVTAGTSETKFSPNAKCTRAQIVTFLWRSAGEPATGGSNAFWDVYSSAYYAEAVTWAVRNNITAGTSAVAFSPNDRCTRAQIVTFLYRSR